MAMLDRLYHYKITVDRIIDGDTIDAKPIDLGFKVEISKMRLRFARINAPESRGNGREFGIAAKEFLQTIIAPGDELVARTVKHDAFGRWIAELYTLNGINLNDEMVASGHAKYKVY